MKHTTKTSLAARLISKAKKGGLLLMGAVALATTSLAFAEAKEPKEGILWKGRPNMMPTILPMRSSSRIFWSNVIHQRPAKEKTTPLSDPKYSNFESPSVLAKSLEGKRSPAVMVTHRGNRLYREVTLNPVAGYGQILANLEVVPIAVGESDPVTLGDARTRMGSVSVLPEGYPEVELLRFATAYGHPTKHQVDVTHLRPVLDSVGLGEDAKPPWDPQKWLFAIHIDSPAAVSFYVTFTLTYVIVQETDEPQPTRSPSKWVLPLLYNQNIRPEDLSPDALKKALLPAKVNIPSGIAAVELHYIASGHGNSKKGWGEFKSRPHNIQLNKKWSIMQFTPWRSDGYKFREVNSNAPKWPGDGDGELLASDLPRSGWVPGDTVEPKTLLMPKIMLLENRTNLFEFDIGGLAEAKPKSEEFWWVSAVLVGYE